MSQGFIVRREFGGCMSLNSGEYEDVGDGVLLIDEHATVFASEDEARQAIERTLECVKNGEWERTWGRMLIVPLCVAGEVPEETQA